MSDDIQFYNHYIYISIVSTITMETQLEITRCVFKLFFVLIKISQLYSSSNSLTNNIATRNTF